MSMLMGLVDWESIGKIAVMTVIVGGFMTWALAAGDKWQKGGKNAQDAMRGVYQFVPLQDFSHPWTDEMLYEKYGLDKDEIAFIESMIRPME